MPVFRVPRATVEIEVSRLEQRGYTISHIVVDRDDLLLFTTPLPHWPGTLALGCPKGECDTYAACVRAGTCLALRLETRAKSEQRAAS